MYWKNDMRYPQSLLFSSEYSEREICHCNISNSGRCCLTLVNLVKSQAVLWAPCDSNLIYNGHCAIPSGVVLGSGWCRLREGGHTDQRRHQMRHFQKTTDDILPTTTTTKMPIWRNVMCMCQKLIGILMTKWRLYCIRTQVLSGDPLWKPPVWADIQVQLNSHCFK